jgi:phosphoenolpyruvate synthase/pyruvate phosphate dikinase
MLLARAILRKADPRWEQRLESHDSFYVGSDVFYTYLVQNGCWWLRRRQKDFATYLRRAEEARQKILAGTFPEVIQNQFMEMLEYFGQSPLIVRSSSLLEDNYGNAFSGKYESVFLANQGSPQDRLTAFLQAVRTVYASTMSEEGLRYRLHHGLLDRDEQMALLVQRVSGELCGSLFFPHLAGVGLSFNPFVWSQEIDPEAGMLRLVFGLGTRAVDRNEDATRGWLR